jgi:hypothetical protein
LPPELWLPKLVCLATPVWIGRKMNEEGEEKMRKRKRKGMKRIKKGKRRRNTEKLNTRILFKTF